MRAWQAILAFLVAGTAAPVYWHGQLHGELNPVYLALAFFIVLNTLICLWEICLALRIDHVEALAATYRSDSAGRELDVAMNFFNKHIPLSQLFSPTQWADVWASYSVFDPSYANRESFGFFVDIGNGFTTILPGLLFLVGMTMPVVPAWVLGIVGLIIFYQMFYGTVIYFTSFLFNKRYARLGKRELVLFVGFSNTLWLVLPLLGMYASVDLIHSNTFQVLRGG